MITQQSIIDAVSAAISVVDPAAVIYPHLCPVDFKRPSHYVRMGEVVQTQTSRTTVEVKASVLITSFVSQNQRGKVEIEDLLLAQRKAAAPFLNGKLKVGSRSLEIPVIKKRYDIEMSEVEIVLSYMDDNIDDLNENTDTVYQTMESVGIDYGS